MERGRAKKEASSRGEIRGARKEEKKKGAGETIQEKEKGQVNGKNSKRKDEEEKLKEQDKEKGKCKGKQEEEKSDCTWTSTLPKPREESKQILVLGLDGAGKTSILHTLASNGVQRSLAPTRGFNAMCINTGGGLMEFLEIGGSEPFRSSWEMHLSKGLLLIFVVDSADHNRLPEAKKYLHQLIEAHPILPLVVFAHKQDLEAAYDITDIHEALALSEVGNDRKLFLFGTQVTKTSTEIPSIMEDAKDLIAHLAATGP
ncbi:ADP-ribosylation factor-like protein 9 isoform X2 [Fukomys damarensis]|uniref:ADP-ribosylation factor-like protein 9 n=1 Tax=Fukomys damarensis TaxID=885580 RepID=A0A091ENZ0_FUKDA|nr:ADP-ribosylation factor-like protein 9 isoform X2 [Fukomys damarensis]KFO37386.1 ADP-ribosylation factor-like protein 9 [Fukomys damarensis]